MGSFILMTLLLGAHGEGRLGPVAALQFKLLINSSPIFGHAVDRGLFTNAELDQMLIYGAAVEPLSPARSVGLVRDKLVKELSRVTSLPLGWRHFNESESSNPHPVWGLIRDLENATARAEAFLIRDVQTECS